ncbi:MAG: arginine biosynthesis bifunctional protein ArgJ, partial [Actinobacteria bacterium]
MTLPQGFTASGIAAGLKPSGRPDVGLLVSEMPAVATGVFTTNRVVAAPVV